MKSDIIAVQRGSLTTVIVTPFSASHSCPPLRVSASPISTAPMLN
jgi:hypothetical protein